MPKAFTSSYTRWYGWFAVIGSGWLLVKAYLGAPIDSVPYALLLLYAIQKSSAHPYSNIRPPDAPPKQDETTSES